MKDSRDIIKSPLVSEKSIQAIEKGKYTFKVDTQANKIEIGRAVEDLFKVKVKEVNTFKMSGKKKVVRRKEGRTSNWKKAIVTLKEGQKIEIFEGA